MFNSPRALGERQNSSSAVEIFSAVFFRPRPLRAEEDAAVSPLGQRGQRAASAHEGLRQRAHARPARCVACRRGAAAACAPLQGRAPRTARALEQLGRPARHSPTSPPRAPALSRTRSASASRLAAPKHRHNHHADNLRKLGELARDAAARREEEAAPPPEPFKLSRFARVESRLAQSGVRTRACARGRACGGSRQHPRPTPQQPPHIRLARSLARSSVRITFLIDC